jgi:hypothetical protein
MYDRGSRGIMIRMRAVSREQPSSPSACARPGDVRLPWLSPEGLLDELAILHDDRDRRALVLQQRPILQRIILHNEQVRQGTRLDHPELALHPEQSCGDKRSGPQYFDPGKHLCTQGEFARLVAVHFRQQISAVSHRHTRFLQDGKRFQPRSSHGLNLGNTIGPHAKGCSLYRETFIGNQRRHGEGAGRGHAPGGISRDEIAMFKRMDATFNRAANRLVGIEVGGYVGPSAACLFHHGFELCPGKLP